METPDLSMAYETVAPEAVVVDTMDGFTFWAASAAYPFTLRDARVFAWGRNAQRCSGQPPFVVYRLVEDN